MLLVRFALESLTPPCHSFNVLPKIESTMKHKQAVCAIFLSILGLHPLPADENESNANTRVADRRRAQLTSDYSLKDPFKPQELRSLAKKPTRTHREQRRLMLLFLHAGIKKDKSFQDLLKKQELREAKNVDLALSGYDYALNKSEGALDHILAQLATEDIGADVDTIVVLSTLDEWDRSIRSYRKHFVHTDGAGGLCMVGFRTTRAYLYPRKYKEMRKVIEAGMLWTAPLLPKTK